MISTPFMFSLWLIAYLIMINSEGKVLSTNVVFDYIDWLPLGIKGLMISGLFAVVMSTADSYYYLPDIITNDFLKQYLQNKTKTFVILPKIIIIIFAFIILIFIHHV